MTRKTEACAYLSRKIREEQDVGRDEEQCAFQGTRTTPYVDAGSVSCDEVYACVLALSQLKVRRPRRH